MCSPDLRYFMQSVTGGNFTFNGKGLEQRNYKLIYGQDFSLSFLGLKNGGKYRLLFTKISNTDLTISVSGIVLGTALNTLVLNGVTGTKYLFEITTDGTNNFITALSYQPPTGSTNNFAPIDSPQFTGTPLAPTPASGTNTTQLATTAFVQQAITALVNSSPAALDTLNELAAALGNDPNFATTVNNALAAKLGKFITVQTRTSVVVSYTLALSDNATLIRFEANSAIAVSLPNNLPEGFNVAVCQEGTGQITFTAEAGAALNNLNGQFKSFGQYAICSLIVKKNTNGLSAIYNLDGGTI